MTTIYKEVGKGIAVKDKEKDSKEIEVYLIEVLPDIEGNAKEYKVPTKTKQKDIDGSPIKSSLEGKATIKAIWLESTDSQRSTPPDIYANEEVYIYQYKDTDEYYWRSSKLDPKKRRLERIVYKIGNTKAPLTDWGDDGCYKLIVDTLTDGAKQVTLITTKSDGEPYGYEISVNTSKGQISFKDDIGQYFKMDSEQGLFEGKFNKLCKLDVPDTILTGNLLVEGNTHTKGNNTINGNNNVNGTSNLTGKVNAAGGINTRGCKGC